MPRYTKEELTEAVKNSETYKEVLIKFNLRAAGGNFKHLKKYMDLWQIDSSHFLNASEIAKRNILNGTINNAKPLEEYMIMNSTYSRYHLKNRLYKEGYKERKCELCGQDETWHGKHMSLILDHINGVHNDNRLENLRIVCANCNATLDTHCGKNNTVYNCIDCNEIVKGPNRKCYSCASKNHNRTSNKIDWPSDEELTKLVWEKPRSTLAKELGVSDKAIAKRCNVRNIEQPGRGYWAKQYAKNN